MKHGIDFYINSDTTIKTKDSTIIGDHVAIDKGFYCTTELEIGDYVHISVYCTVIGGKKGKFIMKDFTGLSAGCRIVCCGDNYLSGHLMNPTVPAKFRNIKNDKVVMERFSCLGTNCVVGANSLVTQSTEPWMVYVGTPAKPIKKRPKNLSYKYAKELGYEL